MCADVSYLARVCADVSYQACVCVLMCPIWHVCVLMCPIWHVCVLMCPLTILPVLLSNRLMERAWGCPHATQPPPSNYTLSASPHANLKAVVLVDMHQISHTRYDKLHTYMIINHNGINTQERLTLPANYVRLPPLLNKERKQDGGLSLSNRYAYNTVRPPSNPPF